MLKNSTEEIHDIQKILELPQFQLLDSKDTDGVKPNIIQHFKSLEGEGGNNAIGVTTLFLRLNKCNCSCSFCDTAFSIKGDPKFNLCRADTSDLVTMLLENYTDDDRKYIHSCSITGGEPLLHLESFEKIVDNILIAFPGIDHIIIETNGNLLANENNAITFLRMAAGFSGKVDFTLSISPKLDSKVSYASKVNENDILRVYEAVFFNYKKYLKSIVNIQCKFVHAPSLVEQNEKLMNLIINNNYIEPRTKILVMPFTPNIKSKTFKEDWEASKNETAKYALNHYIRYSPRIHIDRGME